MLNCLRINLYTVKIACWVSNCPGRAPFACVYWKRRARNVQQAHVDTSTCGWMATAAPEWMECMCQDFLVAHWCQQYDSRSWCGLDVFYNYYFLFFFFLSTTTLFLLFPLMVILCACVRVAVPEVLVICLYPNPGVLTEGEIPHTGYTFTPWVLSLTP